MGLYFFKADVFYFIHQFVLEKNLTIQKLQHENFLLQQKILHLPLEEGRIITQLDDDFVIINKINLPMGAAVFGKKSAIGKIIKHTAHTSVIRLITNRESKIAVYIPQKARAILKGEGRKKLKLIYLDFLTQHTEIKKGDVIYTLGIEGQFPKHQPIAMVDEVKDERTIICIPFENVDYLTQVSLLKIPSV